MRHYFCAVCTDDRGPFHLQPLGPNGALVRACSACVGEHPRSGRYAFAAGQDRGGFADRASTDGNGNRHKRTGT